MALGLRLWGIGFGLPYIGYYIDETVFADQSISFLREGVSDLSQWRIGNLYSYLQAGVGAIVLAISQINAKDMPTYLEILAAENIGRYTIGVPYPLPSYYLWGRILVAVMGGLSILVTYLIGRAEKSELVGLTSAFLLSVSSLHVLYSHLLTNTILGLLAFLVAFYVVLLAYIKHRWVLYLLGLPLIYLAIYAKQNNLILLAPLGLAVTMSLWRECRGRPLREIAKPIGAILLLSIAVTVLLSWMVDFKLFEFSRSIILRIFANPYVYGGLHFGNSGYDTPIWMMNQFIAGLGGAVIFLAVLGIVFAIRLEGKGYLLLSVLLPYLLLMSFFTVRFDRWLLPAVPLLAILASLTLEWIYLRVGRQWSFLNVYLPAILFAGIVILAIPSLRAVINRDFSASQTDLRNEASEWLYSNLPQGSSVVIDKYGPYLSSEHHQVAYVASIFEKDLQAYRDASVDYLVVNQMNYMLILNAAPDPRTSETRQLQLSRASQIVTELPLEKEFTGPAVFANGMRVHVYRLE